MNTMSYNYYSNSHSPNYAAPAPPPPLPSTALPKVPPHIQKLDPKSTPIADLVTYFSTIYQHYAQQVTHYKAQNDTKSSAYQWAEYYADLSTRAAHHYNDLLQQQQQQQQQQNQVSQQATSTQAPVAPAPAPAAPQPPPKSFQEYAHRNLSRCTNETQRSAMTELIQLTIQSAIQNGTMHSKNWNHEPLLPLPITATSSSTRTNSYYSSTSSSFPSSSSPSSSNHYHHGKSYLDALKSSSHQVSSSSISSSSSRNHNNSNGNSDINSNSYTSSNARKRTISSPSSSTTTTTTTSHQTKKLRLENTTSKNNTIRTNSNITSTSCCSSTSGNYDKNLPENDSYYGRGNNNIINTTTSIAINERTKKIKKKKKKNNNNNDSSSSPEKSVQSTNTTEQTTTHDFLFGDYISLSSLSTDKYITKNNKLIKVNSNYNNNINNVGKKKNIIQGAVKSNKSKLASRLNRFSGPGGISDASSSTLHSTYAQDTKTAQLMGKSVIGGGQKKLDEEDYEKMTVKGTCQTLEKEYLRLTAPPRAELVRPQHILQLHLRSLKSQWKEYRKIRLVSECGKVNSNYDDDDDDNEKNNIIIHKKNKKKNMKKRRDYNWFCSQLKAIRQDLTVQRIFNAFAVEVYETHAKIALEEGDMNEYNQSQTQLKELYDILTHSNNSNSSNNTNNNGGNGNESLRIKGLQNQNEFIAYRIIYYVFLTGNKKYDGGSSDLFKIMLSLTQEQRKNPYIEHALKVRVAVADNDYHSFFRLQDQCPNSGAYLMDMMIGQIRAIGLQCMMKSYRPAVPVSFVLEELGFAFNGGVEVEEGIAWLKSCGCKLSEDGSLIHTKESVLIESNLAGKKSSSLI